MNSKRVFFLMCAVVGILLIATVGIVIAGNQMLHKKASSLTSYKLDNKVLDEQQSSLNQAKKDIEKYSDLEKIAKSVVPQDKDQAEAVREIVKIAADNGIFLSNISFPVSTLGQTAPKASSTDQSSSSSSATASKAPPVTQVQAVDGIPGVYTLQITMQQDSNKPVTYDKFISFLTGLEQNRRTSQVTNITVTPNPGDRSKITFGLTVQAYIKP
ncbi:MAG TPA: hypothetical protein VLE69_00165 [Candidatus Saccharimonadales bacterium]|nr:hypothetical protein [Candidatus Saccharimonadales bacterium]